MEADSERPGKLARTGKPHADAMSRGVVLRVLPIVRRLRRVLVGQDWTRPHMTSTKPLLRPTLKEHPADPLKWHLFGRLEG